MIKARVSCAFLSLLLALPLPVLAQAQAKPDPESNDAEKQAFEMLDAIATNIPNLRCADNRIYLTAGVADLLWNKDEKRARSLFETLSVELKAVMAGLDPLDQKSQNRLGSIQQQRREIIDRMAQRDPEMALSFLRATRPASGLRTRGSDYLSESNVELHLASLIAQKSPETAVKLVRANLRRGVTYSVVSVLFNLISNHPDTARTLHGEIVDKLSSVDLLTDYEASNAAWNLLNSFPPPQANDETYRKLVDLMGALVLSVKTGVGSSNGVAQNLIHQVPSLIVQSEKFAPSQVSALKQWSQRNKQTQDPGSRVYTELQEALQKETVEELLALTGKYGAEHHTQIYQNASQKALAGGDVNRARQIITEFMPEGHQRAQMLENFDNQLFWTLLNDNKIAEALNILGRIKGVEQKFQLLTSMAGNLTARGEKKQAVGLLSEATTLIESMPRNAQKMSAQLQLAKYYAALDPGQSAAITQPIIVLINQLVEAAATLDGYENSYLNEGEWMKRGHSNLGNMVNSIGQNLGALARSDAQAARSLSNQFERHELRLMAQLEIAQNLLSIAVKSSNFSRNSNPVLRLSPVNHLRHKD